MNVRSQSYQIPDYTAYDQILAAFRRLVPIPTTLQPEDRYNMNLDDVEKDVREQGLAVLLASNPRNPTGQVIECVLPCRWLQRVG
jgi:aspartate/methionine/tyrosine aminotransferase